MFILELTSKQVQARRGYVVVWEAQGKISRVTFQLKEPADTATEVVSKAIRFSGSVTSCLEGSVIMAPGSSSRILGRSVESSQSNSQN